MLHAHQPDQTDVGARMTAGSALGAAANLCPGGVRTPSIQLVPSAELGIGAGALKSTLRVETKPGMTTASNIQTPPEAASAL